MERLIRIRQALIERNYEEEECEALSDPTTTCADKLQVSETRSSSSLQRGSRETSRPAPRQPCLSARPEIIICPRFWKLATAFVVVLLAFVLILDFKRTWKRAPFQQQTEDIVEGSERRVLSTAPLLVRPTLRNLSDEEPDEESNEEPSDEELDQEVLAIIGVLVVVVSILVGLLVLLRRWIRVRSLNDDNDSTTEDCETAPKIESSKMRLSEEIFADNDSTTEDSETAPKIESSKMRRSEEIFA